MKHIFSEGLAPNQGFLGVETRPVLNTRIRIQNSSRICLYQEFLLFIEQSRNKSKTAAKICIFNNVHIKFQHILQKEIARWLDPGCRLIRMRLCWRVVSGQSPTRPATDCAGAGEDGEPAGDPGPAQPSSQRSYSPYIIHNTERV